MPISPGGGFSPYDNLTTILNSARFRLNDKLKSLKAFSGKILEETDPSTQQAVNNAWREMQSQLSGLGVERFKGDIIIPNIPPITSQDPASTESMSWFEFFDGSNFQTTPILPSDLIIPLWMSCRPSGSNFQFPPADRPNMRNKVDGLDLTYKWNAYGGYQWEWRDEKISWPGFLVAVDFRIGYRKYLNDFNDIGTQRWWALPVPLIRCQDPFSKWLCYEFCLARGADGDAQEQMLAVAAACKDEAMDATKIYANDTAMKNQRDDVRRIPYGRAARGGGGYW